MRWLKATRYKRMTVGTDSIDNPIMESVPCEEAIMVRTAPCAASMRSIDGNSFHVTERTFLTNARPSLLEGLSAVEIGGVTYEVVSVNHDCSPSIISARRVKDGA